MSQRWSRGWLRRRLRPAGRALALAARPAEEMSLSAGTHEDLRRQLAELERARFASEIAGEEVQMD